MTICIISLLPRELMKDKHMIWELNSFSEVMTFSGEYEVALLIVIFHIIAVWAHGPLISF